MELNRASRSTRGKRMRDLLGDELEADEEFWNQDAFADEEDDASFEGNESAPEDVIDSDFDQPEVVEVAPVEEEVREKKRKANTVYKDSAATKKNSANHTAKRGRGGRPRKTGLNIELEVFNRSMRRTTKMASAQTMQKRREREQEDTKRRIKKEERDQFREVERELTQEELMKEALKTEEINKASYLELVRLEEEKKRLPATKQQIQRGPRLTFRSRDGKQTLSFTAEEHASDIFPKESTLATAVQPMCVITGLPAKYKDPKTGSYFATVEAFKILRSRGKPKSPPASPEPEHEVAAEKEENPSETKPVESEEKDDAQPASKAADQEREDPIST
uniref:Vps72/YL1 C-terminal domain-containing protein n=1 Tax=Rhodosorus marinus TaxID=101924 RepID=A0A7S2ZFK5_9RHOD|mmetsp:Transcript_17752/g.71578  ORF Transcript_17752/g.71578 Transcript_17752/m.71578 type:complete len:335 (+) Transcript_17752:265-1269(+)|eukprot:CAMPEP_0113956374 /NCGR_PEP_ID=MMETSP0011_2-20120614/2024_1 /TAXON_ID=101924 /ORGANISM="Rhodosorus marinus" /LENGTH=334 /DNA_ID=CAMNT_0000966509 /DNA_START=199 /DNA_END=1203 /DNA_ORIENTATION=- /assembly_acc=CAM_ASM_000156